MGPLAGPVVGGAVVLEVGARIPGLNDSKLLTPDERERLDRIIRRRALAFSICAVDHAQADRRGLIKAPHPATPRGGGGREGPAGEPTGDGPGGADDPPPPPHGPGSGRSSHSTR